MNKTTIKKMKQKKNMIMSKKKNEKKNAKKA